MSGRINNSSPIFLAFAFSLATLPSIFLNSAHAEDCLPKPTGPAPQGSHWYYHTDNGTKCWFLRTPEEAAALAADAANQEEQDAEDNASGDATSAPRPVPPPAKPVAPKTISRAASHAAEANESKPTRSRLPTTPQAAAPSAPANETSTKETPTKETPTKAAANIPAAALTVRWPGNVSPPPVVLTNVTAVQPVSAANVNTADDTAQKAAQSEPNARPSSPSNATDAVTASVTPGEPLSNLLGLRSEHRAALLTTGLSLLTISAGVSLAMFRSRRRRRSDQWQPSRRAEPALLGYQEAALPRIASIHDAPPMFYDPPTNSHGIDNANSHEIDNTLHKLLHELESHRVDRQPVSDYAPKNYRRRM
jgi:hypothetical protein